MLEDLIEVAINMDRVFYDKDSERYLWIYYNPDSNAGGQVVLNSFCRGLVGESKNIDDIISGCYCELSDIGTDDFESDVKQLVYGTEYNSDWELIYTSTKFDGGLIFEYLKNHATSN